MAVNFVNPYSGEEAETCSVSFAAQHQMAGSTGSAQTEAEYNKSKLLGEWGVIVAKAKKGEIPSNTKVLSFTSTNGSRGYVTVKGKQLVGTLYTKNGAKLDIDPFTSSKGSDWINSPNITVTIPKGKGDPSVVDWNKLLKGKSGYSDGQVLAETTDGQNRLVWNKGSFFVEARVEGIGYVPASKPYKTIAPVIKAYNTQGWTYPKPKPQPKKPSEPITDPEKVSKGNPLSEEDVFVIGDEPHVNQEIVAVDDKGGHVTYNATSKKFVYQAVDPNGGFYAAKVGDAEKIMGDGQGWFKPAEKSASPPPPPQVAAPTPATPVNSGSDSVGSMSHEDVAAMFVKIKDDLAKEQGLNIKGANPELDQLVYAKIGEATGYTGAEIKAKIDSYKAAGNKLSALKKKVLAGTYKVPEGKPAPTKQSAPSSPLAKPEVKAKAPDPKPNGVPTTATPKLANEVKAEVKAEVALEPLKHYSPEDVAAAYIIAKDNIVAESNGKWTLYTKDPAMDKAIEQAVNEKLGGVLTAEQQKGAIADYLATGKKLSALKKQLAKQGAFTPQADSMKKSGSAKTAEDKKKEVEEKAEAGYTPTPTPAVAKKPPGATNAGTAAKTDTGKPAPKEVKKAAEESGDISKVSDLAQKVVFDSFKKSYHKSYLTSSAEDNYEAFAKVQLDFEGKYTLLQIIRIVDAKGAKNAGVENGKLFEKKMVAWLSSPEGTSHVKSKEKELAEQAQAAKNKLEAEKLSAKLQDNQPPLPADSAIFQEMSPAKALEFQERMLAKQPFGPGEKAGLRHYTSNAYRAMNGYLRGLSHYKDISETDKRHIAAATRGFRPAPEPMLLRRGTGANQFAVLGVQGGDTNLLWGLTGRKFEDKGFMSTSAAGKAAFGGEVALEIEAPAGTPCMWVDNFSEHPGENEMLLRPGLTYEILQVRQERGSHVVRLRVVDWPGKGS